MNVAKNRIFKFITFNKKTMGKILSILGLLVITSCGICKKSGNEFDGTWLLESKSGGITGKTTKPENEVKLIIKGDKIKVYENNKLTSEYDFKVEKGKVIESAEPGNIIVSNQFKKQSISIKDNKLILREQCYDCYTYVYLKKQ